MATSYDNRDFADMIKLSILRWEANLAFSHCTQSNHNGFQKEKANREKEKEDVVVVAEVGEMAGNTGTGSPGKECG